MFIGDYIHPNALGYDELAATFGDAFRNLVLAPLGIQPSTSGFYYSFPGANYAVTGNLSFPNTNPSLQIDASSELPCANSNIVLRFEHMPQAAYWPGSSSSARITLLLSVDVSSQGWLIPWGPPNESLRVFDLVVGEASYDLDTRSLTPVLGSWVNQPAPLHQFLSPNLPAGATFHLQAILWDMSGVWLTTNVIRITIK